MYHSNNNGHNHNHSHPCSTAATIPIFYEHHAQPDHQTFPSSPFLNRGSSSRSFSTADYKDRRCQLLGNDQRRQENCDQFGVRCFHAGPTSRRVCSTGHVLESSPEKCNPEEGAGGSSTGGRIGRYSAEERKERIERYRSKRNLRNFQKKITYACRKTLADSRPRVRGRFARNGGEAEVGDGAAGDGWCGWGCPGGPTTAAAAESESDFYYCNYMDDDQLMWSSTTVTCDFSMTTDINLVSSDSSCIGQICTP